MFFKSSGAPTKQIEHVWVFLSVFGGFPEDMLGEKDTVTSLKILFLAVYTLHLENIISLFYISCW